MTDPSIIAEINRLEAEADRADQEATAIARASGDIDHRTSRMSRQGSALRYQARSLKRDAGIEPPEAVAAVIPLPTPARPPAAPKPAVTHTREESIGIIAAGAPYDLPPEMAAQAISGGTSVEAFALAAAAHCSRARVAAAHDADVDATVARIVGHAIPPRERAPATKQPAINPEADAIAARIAAA